MSRIMFRQKMPEEIAADAATAPSAAEPQALEDAGFTLEGESEAAKPRKGRRK